MYSNHRPYIRCRWFRWLYTFGNDFYMYVQENLLISKIAYIIIIVPSLQYYNSSMHTLHFRFKKIYLVIDTSFTMVKFSAKDALKNDIIVKKKIVHFFDWIQMMPCRALANKWLHPCSAFTLSRNSCILLFYQTITFLLLFL